MTELPRPQGMGRILRLAMEEVLGEDGLRSVLKAGGTSQGGHTDGFLLPGISQRLESLEQTYGVQPGRGIALRVGRACFAYGLREYGSTLGLTQASFRLQPFPNKVKTLSAAFADLLHAYTDQPLQMEESGGKLLWQMQACPFCRERHTDEPICHLAVGLAQESLYWLSGGKIFHVEETTCIARGDLRCTLQIDEAPLS